MEHSKCTKCAELNDRLFPPKSTLDAFLRLISINPPKKEETELKLHGEEVICLKSLILEDQKEARLHLGRV
jgi:hypothetical protein